MTAANGPFSCADIAPEATLPYVSIILPVRNEAMFIERSLGAVLAQDYAAECIEVLVVDGRSDDETREKVQQFAERFPGRSIALIDNPQRVVPTGFNAALQVARGDVIVRVDGHCEIAVDYVRRCVKRLQETGVDCVGGTMATVGETFVADAIARAQSSPFGVGGVAFRTGRKQGGYVDTLAFGAYARSVFDRLGGYDEELVRNQDDEFNFRLIQAGGKIWLDPSIRSTYYSRASFRRLWRQYYQYGFYKVRVMQKRGAVPSWRHLVPATFVVALGAALVLSLATGQWLWALAVVGPYAAATLLSSIWTAAKGGDGRVLLLLPVAFCILHVAYGSGFLAGLWHWRKRWRDRKQVVASHSGRVSFVHPPAGENQA